MKRTLLALGAAVAIGAAAFMQSAPASAQAFVSSPCCGGFIASPGCRSDVPRGLFTSGFAGCGCGTYGYPAYAPGPYYTQPGLPYVRPYYYHHRFVHPYTHPYMHPYYRHGYRSSMRYDYRRHGAYRANHRAHRHW
jgi:hypothetical protein